jgi:hypothetical protein
VWTTGVGRSLDAMSISVVRLLPLLAVLLVGVACTDAELTSEPAGAAGAAATSGRVEDPDCDEETIGPEEGPIVSAVAVSDGVIEGLCAGEPDERLDVAWQELTSIVPTDDLADLGVFAGYDEPDSDVLAFATLLGTGNDRFGIVVNLPLAVDDPEQMRLTLAHEVSHVFTQTPDQLDIDVAAEDCPTLHNGNGCFLPDALVLQWIDQFWTPEQLASIPDPSQGDEPGAEARCIADPGFLGVYAASSPEEDLAESFSAYVFGLDVPAAVQPRLDFFAQRPEFQAYRDQALAHPEGVPTSPFDECGV